MPSIQKDIHRLKNDCQYYPWGTVDGIATLLNKPELNNGKPVAEFWIGTHAALPSSLAATGESLRNIIREQPSHYLNAKTNATELPYLLKILSAATPLSIQVHPTKKQAERGFQHENELGISLKAQNRNYKDNNHKPELMFALTPFQALVGFRQLSAIQKDVTSLNIPLLTEIWNRHGNRSESECLENLFYGFFTMKEADRVRLIDQILLQTNENPRAKTTAQLFEHYQYDPGVLMAILLNYITMDRGQSIFLQAGIPHAYLNGTGIEVMAASDNVLRAGLTPKHIDLNELTKICKFNPLDPQIHQCSFAQGINSISVPCSDFQFDYICLYDALHIELSDSAEVYLVLEGECLVEAEYYKKGESFIVSAAPDKLSLSGAAELVRVYCPNPLDNIIL